MSDHVVANNITFPNLGAAVEYLHGDLGLEQFDYVPTRIGPVETPTQDQVVALMEKALHDLNPEADVNRVLFQRMTKDCAMQAAVLASALAKQAEENPTNVAREGAKVWKIAASEAVSVADQVQADISQVTGQSEEEE